MENYRKNIEVLEKVLNKVPDEAKEAMKAESDKTKSMQQTEEANNEIKEEENDDEEENKGETGQKRTSRKRN